MTDNQNTVVVVASIHFDFTANQLAFHMKQNGGVFIRAGWLTHSFPVGPVGPFPAGPVLSLCSRVYQAQTGQQGGSCLSLIAEQSHNSPPHPPLHPRQLEIAGATKVRWTPTGQP